VLDFVNASATTAMTKNTTFILSLLLSLSLLLTTTPVTGLGIQSPELFSFKEKQPLRRAEKQKQRDQKKLEAKVNPKEKDKKKTTQEEYEEGFVATKQSEEKDDILGLTLKFVGGFSVMVLSLFLFFMVSEGL
jgi:hypothetical protein